MVFSNLLAHLFELLGIDVKLHHDLLLEYFVRPTHHFLHLLEHKFELNRLSFRRLDEDEVALRENGLELFDIDLDNRAILQESWHIKGQKSSDIARIP